jgi:serine/threonine protein kinase
LKGTPVPAPQTVADLCGIIVRSELLTPTTISRYLARLAETENAPSTATELAECAVRDGLISPFQVKLLLQGKWKNFFLGGKYKVIDHIGSGGMGKVFRCEHRHMRRQVAVKILPTANQDEIGLLRFQREAQAVAMMSHPNIVRAYDIDQEQGVHFIVMEYIAGASFQAIVEARGPLSIPHAVNYAVQGAFGLQHAFEKGLVHRDIKPSNLMLDWGGTVKLLDLGLARFTRPQARFNERLTPSFEPNAVLGTADYLAPEQARSPEVDIRADIYSLGALLYFLLMSKPVFDGGSVTQKLIRHQREVPESLHNLRPYIPQALANVVARMLEKAPSRRFQTPADVIDAFMPWIVDVDPPTEDEMPPLPSSPQSDIDTKARLSTRTVLSPSSRSILSLATGSGSRCN